MTSSELDSRNIAISMRKSVENLVISSQDAIGQSISQALTFSGVITQHANNIIPENRSVSRSPSPSPSTRDSRNTDSASEALDNDKTSESSVQMPSHAGGDSASISSGELAVTVVSATPTQNKDNPRLPNSAKAGDGSRTKKKSWYNALYPTYKSKSDDFKRLFKDLPDDERLIVDYSCALQKDILAHGRLYASQNYLCFYASIFGWETTMTTRWKDVTAITKEKTALVIPNAILVCTEGEKNFLTSFSGRDKAYLMLFRIWQNALMDQPMSSQEFWQWVHSSYGEELGFNSDEEGYGRDAIDDVPPLPNDTDQDLTDAATMDADDPRDQRDARDNRSRQGARAHDSSPPLVTNGDAEYREEEAGDTLPTDMSDTSDSEPDKPHNGGEMEKCTAAHDGKLILRQEFQFNIDNLFTMIFTNSKFNLEFLAVRGTTDYVQAPWQVQGGLKCRQISYTLGLTSGPIGPKEVQVTETQVMNKCSKPGMLYSIDSTSENAGIPYADYFSVQVHYCLQRVSDSITELSIYGHVKYKKSMWPMIKTFLEKNTISGLEDFARILESRLTSEADCAVPAARKARRHRRAPAVAGPEAAPAPGKLSAGGLAGARVSVSRTARPAPPRPAAATWLAALLALLLLINAALYYKLYYTDRSGYAFDIDDLQSRLSSGQGPAMAEWSAQLQAHARRQRGQLLAWRHALDRTVQHLAQTEQALTKLLETIKPSLEKAQKEAESREEL
ncbi:protein Aster-B isoform X3 [Spodoptera frugiperda]|uniref:Protein Aster-B isoform X3 n=1 Tax=Spodoptera frugiperda TaxID=7108 RepID=A0A9R0EQ61_SPOFR|nr:protein Aster-B isoform X3 [Spodoptera frugiperda]